MSTLARRMTGKQAPKVIKRRLTKKQPNPFSDGAPTNVRVVFCPEVPRGVGADAIAVEGLVALSASARRHHVHFTHVRTTN